MKRTVQEQAILDNWPVVTADDIELMNDEFPHYIFSGVRRTAAWSITPPAAAGPRGSSPCAAQSCPGEMPCWMPVITISCILAPGAAER